MDGALLAGTADLLPEADEPLDESPEDFPEDWPDDLSDGVLLDESDEAELDESPEDELDEPVPPPDPELPAGVDAVLLPLPDPARLSVR